MISLDTPPAYFLTKFILTVTVATAAISCDSSRSAPKSQATPSSTAPGLAPASQPATSHWTQNQRLRLLMAEFNKQTPGWPAGRPSEPEAPAAATQPYQFDEIAVLANALARSADNLPAVTSTIPMSDADRAGFLAEARTLRNQAIELKAAANHRNVAQMQQQMDGINSTCISCHSRYREFSGQLNRIQASATIHLAPLSPRSLADQFGPDLHS